MSSNIDISLRPLEGTAMPSYKDIKFFLDSHEYSGYDYFSVGERGGEISIYDTNWPTEWAGLPQELSEYFPDLRVEWREEWSDEGPGAEASIFVAGVKVREGALEWVWHDVKLVSE